MENVSLILKICYYTMGIYAIVSGIAGVRYLIHGAPRKAGATLITTAILILGFFALPWRWYFFVPVFLIGLLAGGAMMPSAPAGGAGKGGKDPNVKKNGNLIQLKKR